MKSIFEIGSDLEAIEQLINELDGDYADHQVMEAINQWVAEIKSDEAEKFDRFVCYIKRLESEAQAARVESNEYLKRAIVRENRSKWLRSILLGYLRSHGRSNAQTSKGLIIAVQKNGGQIPIIKNQELMPDVNDLPEDLVVVRRELDEQVLRKKLESGEVFEFARLGDRGEHIRFR